MAVRGLSKHLQALRPNALKAVRRGARLEGAAAQHLGAVLGDLGGDGFDLLGALDAARPGHDNDLRPADDHALAERDLRAFGPKLAAGELVRRGDAQNLRHPLEQLDIAGVEVHLGSHRAQHRVARAR